METMYDKLGDLLSETLEEGSVKFVKIKRGFKEEELGSSEPNSKETDSKETGAAKTISSAETIAEEFIYNEPKKQKERVYKKKTHSKVKRIYPFTVEKTSTKKIYLPPAIQKCYKILGISNDASLEDIKKAYKEKLKYYHPDKYNGNVLLQKIATNKTREVVEAYTSISNYWQAQK